MALGWAGGPCLPLFLGVLVATGWSRQPQSFPAASEVAMLGSKRWRSYVLLCPSGLHPWLALELTFPSGPDSAVISRKSPQQHGAASALGLARGVRVGRASPRGTLSSPQSGVCFLAAWPLVALRALLPQSGLWGLTQPTPPFWHPDASFQLVFLPLLPCPQLKFSRESSVGPAHPCTLGPTS